jgi:hypothetical protein
LANRAPLSVALNTLCESQSPATLPVSPISLPHVPHR